MSPDEREPSAAELRELVADLSHDEQLHAAALGSGDGKRSPWYTRPFYAVIGFITNITTPKAKSPSKTG